MTKFDWAKYHWYQRFWFKIVRIVLYFNCKWFHQPWKSPPANFFNEGSVCPECGFIWFKYVKHWWQV